MGNRWAGLVVVGIATTFTLGASAGFLRPAVDDDVSAPARAVSPSPVQSPSQASSPSTNVIATTEPAFVLTEVDRRRAAPVQAPKKLDVADPWSASPTARVTTSFATRRAKRQETRPIDTVDPWRSAAWSSTVWSTAWASDDDDGRDRTRSGARLDSSDPWAHARGAQGSTPADRSNDALREAIKHALDAGDLDRAAKLIEVLRTSR